MVRRYVVIFGLAAFAGPVLLGSACVRTRTNNPGGPPSSELGPKALAAPLTQEDAERRAAAVAARVSRAFVKAEHQSGRHLGGEAAVIVSADGYVVYRGIGGGGKKTFVLADGRRATGADLGWSAEWGVGLSKLEGPGPWPFVELAESGGVRAGQWVVTLGYYRLEPEQPEEPLLKVEHVSGSAVGRWFVLNDAGKTDTLNTPAVFDLDGRLVGVGWNPYVSGDIGTVYTDAKVIRDLWKDLAAGKNLDQLRLRGIDTDAEERGRPSAALTAETEAKAKAASVHIRMSRTDRGWSGTIVTPEGLVVTCAHGLSFVLPGTQVIVCLPDGRDVNGEIVGYNHVSDVCAVRITDNGPWPHVEMGHSTRVRPGDPLLFFGYGPGDDDARQPFPRHTSAAAQWDAGWSFNLDLDPKVQLDGGDSGGGVFDADGRLVAYFLGGRAPGNPQIGRRVEVFRAHREEMTGPFQRADAGSWSTERYGSVAMPPLRN